MENITSLILEKIGTPHQIADAMGCHKSAVYNWMRRNQIPAESAWLLHETKLCTQAGVSYELLIWYMDTWRTRHAFASFVEAFSEPEKRKIKREYNSSIKERVA